MTKNVIKKLQKIFHCSSSWLESKSGTSTFVAIDSDRDSCIGAMNQWFLPTRFNQLVVAEASKDLKTICLPQSRFRLRRQVFQCLWHLCAIIAEKTDRSHFLWCSRTFRETFRGCRERVIDSTTTKCLERLVANKRKLHKKEAFIEDVPFNIHTDFRGSRPWRSFCHLFFRHPKHFLSSEKKILFFVLSAFSERWSIKFYNIYQYLNDKLINSGLAHFWCLLKYRKDCFRKGEFIVFWWKR